ncbi:bifunctional diaminohydroxyphosphoribosylaminopyrimidine deaminase/5-amino-6-(5-phosphoribosylamino)uracil reductase RibD [Brachybacterium hainanense]|uniref:Riboflavin biosynthesis protein RibD n=1 Tax=Brachybacterium hainanense TaxID=1541174 RepID=A0ABV6RD95_9MICO
MQDLQESAALARALDIAADPTVPLGPNPRVGCVLLDAGGRILAEGLHRGAGTPHAEADALARAARTGRDVTGATAVVTLEPCTHTGRTGPCTQALIAAGIARVVIARRDPNPVAAGGAARLRDAGIDVGLDVPPDLAGRAAELNRAWEHGLRAGRPLVTAKVAATLDGRAAAADGSSRWITGPAARAEVHRLREEADVVIVGTGTALVDSPSLTARDQDGRLAARQPVRAVMGLRPVPPLPEIRGAGPARVLATRDPRAALAELFDHGLRHVLLEGGPTLLAAFLREGLVDELILHLAPKLLGAGPATVADLGITGIDEALELELEGVAMLRSPGGQSDAQLRFRPLPGAGSPPR